MNIIPLYGFTIFCLFTSWWIFKKSPFGATMNNAPINIYIYVFMWTYIFISLVKIPRSGIAGSSGKFMFDFLRNCQAVFQRGCIILYSCQQCIKVPISLHPHQHVLLSFFYYYCSRSSGCVMVSHRGFKLYYPNDRGWWASFHVLSMCIYSLMKCLFTSFDCLLITEL